MSFGILSYTKMDAIGATWAATWHRVLSGRTRLPWQPRVHLLPCAIGASDWTQRGTRHDGMSSGDQSTDNKVRL